MSDDQSPDLGLILRPHQTGDIGWITHRQALLYASEYGWDQSFEVLVAEIAARFVKQFDPSGERCWIAERDGKILGSVFLVRQSKTIAKLRLLYVEPEARGLGLGRRLSRECIGFARAKGYKKITLWTNAILTSACAIYQSEGFTLVSEERHHSFGHELIGQYWSLKL
jgi:GNAT superfamily N-acetyltransferase